MAKIIVNKKQCQILDEFDVEFLRKLDKELSFWVQGAEHSAAYRGYLNRDGKMVTWDGCRHLLSQNLKFSPGLLPRVKRFFDKHSKSYTIEDVRVNVEPGNPQNIISAFKSQGKTPYSYQLEAVKAAKENDRGIIRIATGGGKTFVAALITAELGKTACIYVIGKDLLYQIHDLFASLFGQEIGIIGDGHCTVRDINVATVWTVGQALGLSVGKADEEGTEKKVPQEKYKHIRDALGIAKVHIFDECHLAACDTIQEIFKWVNPEHIYGMSASPWRDDGADLLIENYLGEKIIDLSAKKLIDGGYLVPANIRFLAVPAWQDSKRARYQSVYSKYIVNNDVRNGLVAKGAEKLVEQGFQTLVLFHSLKHGQKLKQLISAKLPCALLSGKDGSKARDKVKKDLEQGKIKCIVASKIFDIGVDLPSLSGLIVAGGGKSSVRALQRIGRVIRRHPDKTQAAILDFADQAPYLLEHSKIRRDIYAEEFDVKWPEQKSGQQH